MRTSSISHAQCSSLVSLALMSRISETQRRAIGESGIVARLQAYLKTGWGVNAAAAELARSLSRSSLLLRGPLGEAGLAPRLVSLLSPDQPSLVAAMAAAGALANMVIEESPSRQAVLDAGGLGRFVALARGRDLPGVSEEEELEEMRDVEDWTEQDEQLCLARRCHEREQLRLLGFWGLSSLAFRSQDSLKGEIIAALPWREVMQAALPEETVLQDSDEETKQLAEKAWLLLRNLVHGAVEAFPDLQAWADRPALLEAFRRAVLSSTLPTKVRDCVND